MSPTPWTGRTKPSAPTWQRSRYGLWNNDYYPWLSSSYPWQKGGLISTSYTERTEPTDSWTERTKP